MKKGLQLAVPVLFVLFLAYVFALFFPSWWMGLLALVGISLATLIVAIFIVWLYN